MISAILTLLGSSAFGTILGGIFAILNRKADIEAKRLDLAHERDRWAHELQRRAADLEQVKAEAAGRREVAVIEGESAIESARMNALGAAHEADKVTAEELKAAGKWRWMLVVGSALRTLIRPVLTIVLVCSAIYLNFVFIEALRGDWPAMTAQQRFDAGMQAFAWITGQASAVLSYWFLSRGTVTK